MLLRQWPAAIAVANKADLLEPARIAPPPAAADDRARLVTSAVALRGIDELAAAIVARLIGVEPQAGDAIPFTAGQAESLRAAAAAIDGGDLPGAIESLADLRPPNSG